MENKTRKPGSQARRYVKYAIGEIVLVVLGILIALQINLKSQEKTNREHVESILRSVFFNLESDMANPINRNIDFCEIKDSMNNMLLTQELSFKDFELSGQGFEGLGRLLTYEFEPFQFKNQAYERLVSNIEIIPEDYIPIVEMLQDVYNKEVPVVNEVALEVKNFVDEIEDKYQTTYDWYSNTDNSHFKQKVDYMLNDPKHLNDVRRHQYIIDHLYGHLNTLKINVSLAYSKIHNELMFDEPFSQIVERFYFPTEEELKKFTGIYEASDNPSSRIEFESKEYYLTASGGNGVKLINIDDHKFAASIDTKGSYIQFIEDENSMISSFTINRIKENDTLSVHYQKIQ